MASAAVIVTIVAAAVAGNAVSGSDGASASGATTTSSSETPTTTSPAPCSRTSEPAPRNRPEEFPPVRPAGDLSPEAERLVGTEVDVRTSPLRYRVFDMFGETIYNCLFSVDMENLTDRPMSVTVAFRVADHPAVVWDGDSSRDLEPGDRSELVLGWDGSTPEEVGVTESQCAGQVELTELTATPR